MSEPVRLGIVGAGNRGREVYGRFALDHPELVQVVAVAEPRADRRAAMAAEHGLTEGLFSGWEELLAAAIPEAIVVATQDQEHTGPAIAALAAGAHVLLEKPMAHRAEDCVHLVAAAQQHDRVLQICHVLRHTPLFLRLKGLLDDGALGHLVSVSWHENVSFWHMAHSYVRGHWANRAASAPMLLAKCCHDLDLILWLTGRRVERLSSVGSLHHFREDQAPAGAPARCTDGCPAEETCPFEARRIYVTMEPILREMASDAPEPWRTAAGLALRPRARAALEGIARLTPALRPLADYHGWPRSVISEERGDDAVLAALRTGPWGRCVYRCDNDVVDHQVVCMEMEGGLTATLTMHGHSHKEHRTARLDGTLATVELELGQFRSRLRVHRHRAGHTEETVFDHPPGSGHGGGDDGLMRAFLADVRAARRGPSSASGLDAEAALESHLLAFAADDARLSQQSVDFPSWRAALDSSPARRDSDPA